MPFIECPECKSPMEERPPVYDDRLATGMRITYPYWCTNPECRHRTEYPERPY